MVVENKKKMVVKVKKKDLEAFFTCSLCSELIDNATTISECVHRFCRSCIEDKLIAAKQKACPVCNVDLGGFPLDKLRPDYTWDNMKQKLFPRKQEGVKTGPAETVAASLKSSEKKESFLSCLLASSSRVSVSPNLNQDAPLESNVPVVEKLSEKMEATPIITFRKREKKTSKHKKIAYIFPFDLNTVPDCTTLAEASTSQGYMQKEKNSEKDKEVAPLNINDSLQVIVVPEPAIITPNGRENQDCVLTSSEEDTGVILKNNGKGILVDSTSSSGKVSGEKLKNNGEINQEKAASSSGKVSGKKLKNNGKGILVDSTSSSGKVSGEKLKNNGEINQEKAASSSGKFSGKKLKNNGKGILVDSTSSSGKVSGEKLKNNGEINQEKAASSSGKFSGKKLKNNGKGKQICLTPKSGKSSAMKLKEKSYSPPVLRSRVKGRAISSAASTSEVDFSLIAEDEVEGRNIPVWFTLVASNRNTDRPLPQIPVPCLKVTGRNMSVSHVKKYIVLKLGLESEDEVEIWLRDEPVCSSQTLHNLVDWWVETTPLEERKSAMVGSSAAEFIMVLHYSHKVTSDHSDSE